MEVEMEIQNLATKVYYVTPSLKPNVASTPPKNSGVNMVYTYGRMEPTTGDLHSANKEPQIIYGFDYGDLDENGNPKPISTNGYELMEWHREYCDAFLVGSLSTQNTVEFNDPNTPTIDIYSDNVHLTLYESATNSKSNHPHGGFASYDGIDWAVLEGVFSSESVLRTNTKICYAEQSIEYLAANYAIYAERIKSSIVGQPMGDEDMKKSLDRLELLYENAKQILGNRLLSDLNAYLQRGGINADYNDLPSAISDILDVRIREYTSIIKEIVEQKGDHYLKAATSYYVKKMYSKPYLDNCLRDYATPVGESKRYTYADIQSVFDSLSVISIHFPGINNPSIPYNFREEELGVMGGFAMLAIAVNTSHANQDSPLLKDFKESMLNQFREAAEIFGKRTLASAKNEGRKVYFSTEHMLTVMKRFMEAASSPQFGSNVLSAIAEYQLYLKNLAAKGYNVFDAFSIARQYLRWWNQMAAPIDGGKYIIGKFNGYV
jgi:hypothetical protein